MTTLPCPPAQWPRFSALLDAALDVPEAARDAWLDTLGSDDAALRPFLARVLGNPAVSSLDSASQGDFWHLSGLPEGDGGFSAGASVGPYVLKARLGEGGMGEVWSATRRDDGPQREVALKLPHADLLGGPFRARFARERDMLATLSHPHIAQLYDAGSSHDGHPYLALELVHGQPITEATRRIGASLERRVDLLLQVLEGLAYAHQRLIVHRDIKPSNVLVTPEGDAKLLDFGIAKLLRPETSVDATLTQAQTRLATPAYAAPEQFGGGPITVGTDLFAAGVLLFELCTGHRPFLRAPLDDDAPDAPLASQRADAAAAGMDDRRLASRLRGDLDAVIAKAIAWLPAARYTSAEAFAADLRRWRAGQPVRARHIGWPARAQKFVRRNRGGVALAGVLALALAGGTAGIAWQAHRAELQAARANAIKDYLLGLFAHSDPRSGKSIVNMSARELLDNAADSASAAFAHDPATEIELLQTLANIYDALSDATRSEALWNRELELARRLYGPADPHVVETSLNLVASEALYQDEDRARPQLAALRAPVLALYGSESLQWAQFLAASAMALRDVQGARDEAIADDQAAIAIYARHFPDNRHYPAAVQDLSGYQYDAEECAASLASLETARTIDVAQHAFDPVEELQYHGEVGTRLACVGRLDDAEAELRQAQALAERLFGRQNMWYLHSVVTRAVDADMTGERDRAIALLQSLLTPGLNAASATGLPTSVRRAYAATLARQGRAAEAVPLMEAALRETRLHPRDEPNVRRAELQLGDAYDQVGRVEDARALLRAARDEFLRYANPGMPYTVGAQERWGRFLLDHGHPQEAAAEFTAALASAHGAASAQAAMAASGLARVALAAGALPEAEAQSARALALLDATEGIYDARLRVEIWMVRAQVLAAGGRMPQAQALAEKAVAAATQYDAPVSRQLARVRAVLQGMRDATPH